MTNEADQVVARIDAASLGTRKPRLGPGRIGASQIGEEARSVWLAWRWCLPRETTGQDIRRFRLGDLIEAELVGLLRRAGFEVYDRDQDGEQFGYHAIGGHYAMRLDGILRGLESNPTTWAVLEVKSMAGKYFRQLVKEGVELGRPQHYAQCQVGMFHARLPLALYIAQCKDTSLLYVEVIHADDTFGAGMVTKATDVALAEEPPASTFKNRSDWRVKMKPEAWRQVYWGDHLPERPSCRSCRFSKPDLEDTLGRARWACERHACELSREQQEAGCADHNWIPGIVQGDVLEVDDATPAVKYNREGVEFWNVPHGSPAGGSPCYSSWELSAISRAGWNLVEDEFVNAMREKFGATFQTVTPADADDIPF